jgi:elongation factor P
MIAANELRKGVTFELDDQLYKVVDYSHHKPGRGLATIKVKILNLRTGSYIEKTFSSNERVQNVRLDYHQVEYLYHDGEFYHFMDLETYEQPAIPVAVLGDTVNYLTENMKVKLTFYQNEPIDIDLPTSVELKVVKAEPSVRGDTATGVNKTVVTETGLEVSVPAFVDVDDVIKVDTRSGEYITRV